MGEVPTLRGRFVVLRPLAPEDAETTLRWRLGDRAINLNRGAETAEQQARWIASRPDSEYNFVVELADGRPVGMVSLIEIDLGNRRAQPARFLIGEPEAVRGVPAAVEAMLLVYELAFDGLGLHRLYGTVVSDNPQMLKWQKYLGMVEEGRLRDHYFINGHFQDAICLALMADDYRESALPRMRALVRMARG